MKLKEMDDQRLAKAIRQNRIKILADIILVIVLIGITFYIANNIAYIKAAESMSIEYCEAYLEKIGMECFAPQYNFPKLLP